MPKETSIEAQAARHQRGGRHSPGQPRHSSSRRQLRQRRLAALVALLALALLVALVVALSGGPSAAADLASNFARAWSRHEYAVMYSDIDAQARTATPLARFEQYYRAAQTTATAVSLATHAQSRELSSGDFAVPATVKTRVFGTLHREWQLPIQDEGERPKIAWSPSLSFPGLPAGGRLTRRTTLPARAAILASDGSALAEGDPQPGSAAGQRRSALGAYAEAIAGDVGPIPAKQRPALEAAGVPSDAFVGTSGLELAYDERLRGSVGGELFAGGSVIARAQAHPAPALRTSIVPGLQKAAVAALGGQLGGIVALRPQSGEVLAVAGLGIDDTQPPGSTFKIITTTGALSAGIASMRSSFPYATATTLEGQKLENAHGESCGGTLEQAFAASCNSVFIPLGVKLGAQRLVQTAESFGFNHSLGIPGAVESSIPAAADLSSEVEVGSSAIGQGRVLSSPLAMAAVAATVADGGRRPQLSMLAGGAHRGAVGVMSAGVAHLLRQLMLAVVTSGTGTAAAIPGVEVAGKTGTAELGPNPCRGASEGANAESAASKEAAEGGESCASKERANTDAWFAAFAPARQPRIALAVLMVKDGAGGETAAPVARQVIEAALSGGR